MSLDREIEDLLAVDPSSDFVAKVRRRVAAEQVLAASWLSWRLVPLSAGLVAALAAVVLWPSTPTEPVAPSFADAGRVGKSTTTAGSAPDAPLASVAPRAPTTQHAIAPPAEVLVSPQEAAAFELLLTRVREGQLPDMTESLAVVDAIGPEWIAIAPLVIDPIPQAEGE